MNDTIVSSKRLSKLKRLNTQLEVLKIISSAFSDSDRYEIEKKERKINKLIKKL